ncbi:MAG: hypothetical protein K9I74_07920 [Bacteroidales bacterium]|nr:hypothetical protein [Bacteroidales bacterium]
MLQPLLELYNKIEGASQQFTDAGITPFNFFDVYRSQPTEPELYEYFPLPAIFVDYSMQGQGINQPRLITMTLHLQTDEMPSAANISEQKLDGVKRFMYGLKLQEILENSRLGKTTALRFVSEDIIDVPVVNYHSQTYQFEAYIADMMDKASEILGEFETLNIFGSLKNLP